MLLVHADLSGKDTYSEALNPYLGKCESYDILHVAAIQGIWRFRLRKPHKPNHLCSPPTQEEALTYLSNAAKFNLYKAPPSNPPHTNLLFCRSKTMKTRAWMDGDRPAKRARLKEVEEIDSMLQGLHDPYSFG